MEGIQKLQLLNRVPEASYIDRWTSLIGEAGEENPPEGEAVVIFSLGTDHFAIAAKAFCRIIDSRKVHSVPRRSKGVLEGVLNFQGRLRCCINMREFLGLNDVDSTKSDERADRYGRMLALQDRNDYWIFSVSQIYGVYRLEPSSVKNVPVTIVKSSKNYLKGIFDWNGTHVGLFDDELLFYSLNRSLQ